ncbi:MAG: nuclear transport factor 2 family protein [Rehaibacterium terrae]|uniref:nuclear transport factor 2 family protein n=1 Tax=Rehaibacterium terrae TaxID=1341696 RepID=UPI003918DE2F
MNEPLESFCDRWLASWTGGDPDRLLAFYAHDAVYIDPAWPDGLRGHAALHGYLSRLLRLYPDWVWRREALHPVPGGFILRWRARLHPDSTHEARGMDLIELEGGLIVRNEVYFDPRHLFGASR